MKVDEDGKVAVDVPDNPDEARDMYDTDPVFHSMIRLHYTRSDFDTRSVEELIEASAGNTLRVDAGRIGLVDPPQ